MRIVAKIANSGSSCLSRFPVPDASVRECCNAAGRLDETKVRRALAVDQVQIGSKDDMPVLAFGLEYLSQQRAVVERLAHDLNASGDVAAAITDTRGVRTEPATPGDRRCERNMNHGRVAYFRTDVTSCRDGIHVKISVQNPRAVVGHTEAFARDYAVMCARILLYLRNSITTARIVLIEGDGADGIFAEARSLDRRDDLAKLRAACDRLHNGHCSPINPDCPLYRCGRCALPDAESPAGNNNNRKENDK